MLTIKLIGPMLRQAITARIASTLAITLAAGMTLIDALQIAAEASGNFVYRQALRAISDEILTGQRLTMAMQKQVLFSALMIDMVAVGEESGKLDLMLSKVANFYDEQVNHSTHQLTTLMEPLMMLILGLLIGILVIALYLPIFRLGSIYS
jgi:type IV pilus assembly protein PilC